MIPPTSRDTWWQKIRFSILNRGTCWNPPGKIREISSNFFILISLLHNEWFRIQGMDGKCREFDLFSFYRTHIRKYSLLFFSRWNGAWLQLTGLTIRRYAMQSYIGITLAPSKLQGAKWAKDFSLSKESKGRIASKQVWKFYLKISLLPYQSKCVFMYHIDVLRFRFILAMAGNSNSSITLLVRIHSLFFSLLLHTYICVLEEHSHCMHYMGSISNICTLLNHQNSNWMREKFVMHSTICEVYIHKNIASQTVVCITSFSLVQFEILLQSSFYIFNFVNVKVQRSNSFPY